MIRFQRSYLLSAGILAAALPAPLVAQDRPADWSGQITPYVWASGLGGSVTPLPGGPTLDFDKSFGKVLEDLDIALFLAGQIRYQRIVVMGDFSTSTSSKEGSVPVPGVGILPAEGRLSQRSITLTGGYRVADEEGLTLDVMGGLRHWSVRSAIDVAGGAISRSPRASFTDPLVAVKANVGVAPRLSAIAYGDIGIGSRSTAQLLLTLNYQVSEHIYLSAGYRQLWLEYAKGGARGNVTMAGPLLGATWRF
jgi:hypothetical protein